MATPTLPGRRAPALGLVAAAFLVLAVGLLGWNQVASRQASRAIRNAGQVATSALRILSAMKDLETGERGFLLTGDESYLEPYYNGLRRLDNDLSVAGRSGGTDSAALRQAVVAKRDYADAAIRLRRNQGMAAALADLADGRDKGLMDSVRDHVAQIQGRAESEGAGLARTDRLREVVLTTLSVLCAVIACGCLATLAWQRRVRERVALARLEGVLDNAPIGLGFLDSSLRLRQANKAMAKLGAGGPGIGQTVWDALPGLQDKLGSTVRDVAAGGRAVTNVEAHLESTTGAGQDVMVSLFPLHRIGRRSETAGVGIVVNDVTQRTEAERSVQRSEQRFRTLTEATAAILWTTGPQGDMRPPQPDWSAFTGQDSAALAGLGWLDAVHPDDKAHTIEAWKASVDAHLLYEIEHRLRRWDGTWHWMQVRAAPVLEGPPGPSQTVREWVGTHVDISARKRAEEEMEAAKSSAEQANRAKSQFIANMSHELRTPLSAVIGYSEMLEEEVSDLGEPHLTQDLKKINASARHLLSLINDVLDLSKIEADRMTLYIEEFAGTEMVQEVATTVEPLIQGKGNRLVLDVAPDLGMLRSDQTKVRQCLFNLLSNAAKFTENGTITMRARRLGSDIAFDVQDSGIGMTPEQVERVFERFTQADASTTRKFGGSGLGLAITRAFAHLLGGEITVESQAAVGSTFSLRIAASLTEQGVAETAAEAQADPDGCVLVIDDDRAQREMVTRFLEREGFTVCSAADGQAGLAMARTRQPRAVLLDVMMPVMDGWAVLAAMKADPDLRDIPVVMCSFVREQAMGLSLGAEAFVTKPLDWDKLRDVMQRFRDTDDAGGDVLVVDDDVDARGRLRSVLENQGWTVSEAGDGREALESVKHHLPRLVLLDLTMPVMDGFSFLTELRRQPGCEHLPVMVLTARDLTADDRLRLQDAERVLTKGNTSLRDLAGQVRAVASARSN